MIDFPATKIFHWPTGPVFACDRHVDAAVRIGAALGMQVPITDPAPVGSQCQNCINENKSKRGDNG